MFKKFSGQVFRPNDEVEARKFVKIYERSQTQSSANNFLNFSSAFPKASNWEKSKSKLMKKPEIKDKKSKQTSATSNSSTKITISSPVKSPVNKPQSTILNKLTRSNSSLYLAASNKSACPSSPTGIRRKLMNPQSILKKQMSIDSLTIQTSSLTINQPPKSPSKTTSFLQPFDQKKRKPISAPASTGRFELKSNPELSSGNK